VAGGLAVRDFGYRHFGESEGLPRQQVDSARQRADLHRAVEFARDLPEVDGGRAALVGAVAGGMRTLQACPPTTTTTRPVTMTMRCRSARLSGRRSLPRPAVGVSARVEIPSS
jgi:dienelactone hydrolase